MKTFTEAQLEIIENDLMSTIDDNLNYMSEENRVDLIDMLIDSLESRKEEL